MGFIVPPIHIHDNLQLKPYEYNIMINGAKVSGGELNGQYLAMDAGSASGNLEGTRTTEPVFGLPAIWIKGKDREQAQVYGYTVVDNTTILATHVSEIIKKHAHELVGRQELQQLLDSLSSTLPKVVEELVPSLLSLGTVLRVVKNLLRENVSIRDLRSILETLADYGGVTKDPETLTEFVRQSLGRYIVEQYKRRMIPSGFSPSIGRWRNPSPMRYRYPSRGAIWPSNRPPPRKFWPRYARRLRNSTRPGRAGGDCLP